MIGQTNKGTQMTGCLSVDQCLSNSPSGFLNKKMHGKVVWLCQLIGQSRVEGGKNKVTKLIMLLECKL